MLRSASRGWKSRDRGKILVALSKSLLGGILRTAEVGDPGLENNPA